MKYQGPKKHNNKLLQLWHVAGAVIAFPFCGQLGGRRLRWGGGGSHTHESFGSCLPIKRYQLCHLLIDVILLLIICAESSQISLKLTQTTCKSTKKNRNQPASDALEHLIGRPGIWLGRGCPLGLSKEPPLMCCCTYLAF